MDLKEFYQGVGGDFENVLGRFGGMEAMVKRFLGKFAQDGSYQKLLDAVEQKDAKAIEAAAHTLKGVCSNLGISRLQELTEKIMFHVREGKPVDEVPAMLEPVKKEYKEVIGKLEKLLQ